MEFTKQTDIFLYLTRDIDIDHDSLNSPVHIIIYRGTSFQQEAHEYLPWMSPNQSH